MLLRTQLLWRVADFDWRQLIVVDMVFSLVRYAGSFATVASREMHLA